MNDRMQWNWLANHVRHPRDADYARRVLDGYRLGMKARGAVRGVRIIAGSDSCPICRGLADREYLPDDAPLIPIAGCTHPGGCQCAYGAVMTYEATE